MWRIYRKEQLGLNGNHRFYSIEQKWMVVSSVFLLWFLSLGIYWLFFSNPPSKVMGISFIILSFLLTLELPIRKFTIQLPDTKLEAAESQENIIIGFGPFGVFHKEINIKKVQILVVRHKVVSIERTSYEPGERSRYQVSVVTNSNEHKITPLGQFENMLSLEQLVVDFLKNMALLKSNKSYINHLIFQAVLVDINDEIEPVESRRHFLEWVEQNKLNITYGRPIT